MARLKSAADFRRHLASIGADLPFDERLESGDDGPLAKSFHVDGRAVGNRFAILPMEGWDATGDGLPSDLVRRRWRRFGLSGAKLIWGGEAVAVRPDGRANPNQLLAGPDRVADFSSLREELVSAHEQRFGTSDDLLVGLQLTHSGRFARPQREPAPRIVYRHPLLDRRVDIDSDAPVWTDAEIETLIDGFVEAARMSQRAGFDFVDVKHCHGYLGHEFLSAFDRPGAFGGDFDGRTRFLRQVVAGIRAEAPGLAIGVRFSAYDFAPFSRGADNRGRCEVDGDYRYAFGGDGTGAGIDLVEPLLFCDLLRDLGIHLVCTTAGSPYYNPHIQRPAFFPPSDGYDPPEDPLLGVSRMLAATAELKRRNSDLYFVGSGMTYLQEWLPHVAQKAVRDGVVDSIGIGRMALSYPELPADVLAGKQLRRRLLCRTFSDCTTAPRHGMVSGCYPIDEAYKNTPEAARVAALKKG
jgi:2,4-dienoyl-CoA reductase-like NADH-dependent reductase (Old Yellow Enzyme family)